MHHDRILKKFLPKLKKHFDKQGVDSGIYTLKWFFQCFLDRVKIITDFAIGCLPQLFSDIDFSTELRLFLLKFGLF
jgi:hypothetical protein